MDCEGILFSELIPSSPDNVTVFDDMYQDLASWEVANLAEDVNNIGLMSTEPAIEGPSVIAGDFWDSNDQGLDSGVELQTMYPMELLLIGDEFRELRVGEKLNWLKHRLDNLLYQDPPESNEFLSFPVDPVAAYFGASTPCSGSPETDQFLTFTDPVNTHASNSTPCLDIIEYAYEGQSIQSFPDAADFRSVSASHGIEWVNTTVEQREHQDSDNILACIIDSEFQRVRSCGHSNSQQYCRDAWQQACPDCWYSAGEDVNASQVYGGAEVDCGSNLNYKTDHEYAQEFIIYQPEYQPGLAPAQELDTIGYYVQHDAGVVHQAAQELTLEYQAVRQQAGREFFHETLPNEAIGEWEPPVMPVDTTERISSTSKQTEQRHGSRKRGRETLVVDHNGVAMRYDGFENRFTAYYRPSYWTEDDSSVFLGEYPTHEEAADAHNLVALLHEGRDAQIILPYTANRYTDQLKRWEGKHQVDLVCELRLRGRGLLNDGAVNYKHVGRRWSRKKKGTRYFSTVSDDPVSSSDAKTGKPKRSFLTTFDTPEQAAEYADQVLVKRKGPEAWTNFPLSSYIASRDELPLSFLPISNNFRDNLTYRRSKPDVV